jgi:hypothetical protein
MTLQEYLDNVQNRRSFEAFVKALIEDRKIAAKLENKNPDYGSLGTANDWQNWTIEDYLESALSWLEDSQSDIINDSSPQSNHWKFFAVFLYCGKIYE